MHLAHYLRFASDATLLGIAALALQAFSLLAWWRDRRRQRRNNPDAVGLLPWRDIAALTGFAALVMLAMAAIGWISG